MKFMLMVFADRDELRSRSPEWAETVAAFMVHFDDELAHSGELIAAEVLEFGEDATLVDRHGGTHRGSFSGTTKPLSRFWVVRVPDEARAIVLATKVAEAVGSAVEVRQVWGASHRP